MTTSVPSPPERPGRVVGVLITLQHVLLSLATGIMTFIVGFVTGVWSDVVGILWYREEDYPYMDAWLAATVVTAVVVAAMVWWALHARTRRG